MILDEALEYDIIKPFKISSGGDFVQATKLELLPPTPQMARDTFKLNNYFSAMNKEVAAFAASMADTESIQEARAQQIVSGAPVESIHVVYKDGDPAAKDSKLKEIEAEVKQIASYLSMCEKIDLYAMVTDFGKMVTYNRKCFVKALSDSGSEVSEPLTMGLWENNIEAKDRLQATIRYCCFFGLTSSMID